MWKTSNLTDLASVSTGKWDANHAAKNGRYRFYTCAATHLYSDTKRFSGECLILPGNGANIGDVYFYEGDFDSYQRTYVIHDIKILPKFLYFHLLLNWKDVNSNKQFGSATNFIKMANFKDYKVSYPLLTEQRRIAAKLYAAFSSIDKAIKLNELKRGNAINGYAAYTEQTFRGSLKKYEQSTLGELCEFYNGKAHEKDISDDGKFYLVNSRFISSDGNIAKFTTKQKFPLIEGDNVMVMSDFPNGKALAKTMRITASGKYSLNQRICCIRSNHFHPQFLQIVLNRHPHFLSFNDGENQTNLRKKHILECPLPKLSLDEQISLLKQINLLTKQIRNLIKIYKKQSKNFDALKSAILAQELQSEAA